MSVAKLSVLSYAFTEYTETEIYLGCSNLLLIHTRSLYLHLNYRHRKDIREARLFPVKRFKTPLDLLAENLSGTTCEAFLTKRFSILP